MTIVLRNVKNNSLTYSELDGNFTDLQGQINNKLNLTGGTLTGPLTVGGTFSATSINSTPIGSITPSSGVFTTLNATGNTTLAALSATTGTFSSTLNVAGVTTLATLNASNPTFTGNGSIGGSWTVGGVLNVIGSTTLAALNATTGSFSSTLNVTGATTLAALSATSGTFSSTLGVTGATTLAGLSATTGAFSSTLNVTGATTLAGLTASSTTFTGNGSIAGNWAIGGGLTMSAANAGFELGGVGVANTPYLDWHTGTTGTDYDVRFLASGGNGVVGNGAMTYTAYGGHTFYGSLVAQDAANCLITSQGNAGYGGFSAKASGTGISYLFFGNVTNGERTRVQSDNSRTFVVSNDGGATNHLLLDSSGNATFSGNVTAYSDEIVKTDWQFSDTQDYLKRLSTVKAGDYARLDIGIRQRGVGAQSLQAALGDTPSVMTDDKGRMSVAYGQEALHAAVHLARAVQTLESRIAAIEAGDA